MTAYQWFLVALAAYCGALAVLGVLVALSVPAGRRGEQRENNGVAPTAAAVFIADGVIYEADSTSGEWRECESV